jgi:hypothetical protein
MSKDGAAARNQAFRAAATLQASHTIQRVGTSSPRERQGHGPIRPV